MKVPATRFVGLSKMRIVIVFMLLLAPSLFAQRGDRAGETQVAPLKESEIPLAPILSPEESLKMFKTQPGFKIEVVASEPLVEAPVAMAFHPNGSLFVVEMRGFMPNVDGDGEDLPAGRVSVLQDTDHDGRMDKSTVFLDGLVLPRSIALVHGGVLVAETPNLWFCRDTNNDLVADEKTLVTSEYGRTGNPEHTANGLLWGLDNWIYSAGYTNKIRRANGKWIFEPTAVRSGRGQWGISQDDLGRLFFNSNSDYLRGDLLPADLLLRNPKISKPYGANVQIDRNQAVFPVRVNPGVNRAYQKGQLREDGTLATFTAACGPLIYRGDQFDPQYYGAAFVCEPSANLIRCSRLSEANGVITGSNAFPNAEFLGSTEERFRPVNLSNGPDGALYVVDMHRGLLQHRVFLTTYLRQQTLARKLESGTNLGRIYRITQEGRPARRLEPLRVRTAGDLVAALRHPNAWSRETAQRLLVERSETESVGPLDALARDGGAGVAAVHSLWTLQGMGKLKAETVLEAMKSGSPLVRATAARLAGELGLSDPVEKLAEDADPLVKLHATLSLKSLPALAKILRAHPGEQLFHHAILSSVAGNETAFHEEILKGNTNNLEKFLSVLSGEPKPASEKKEKVPPLTAAEEERFKVGKETYTLTCAACHQPHGLGQDGLAPPLVDSDWVTGSPSRLVRIILQGLRGPLKVKDKEYNLEMPPLNVLDDEQIASIMTYVRREWGHAASPITPEFVNKARMETAAKEEPWSEADLRKIP